ncbi:MAG: FAD:protein FMN transferase [Bifidobacteriaceae bacterium]|jgi:thiamine biosynthesis lipoprotein ApbE|nr:FAD:protein FMN transferase [Bifidobacteriaceae bacterium]
MKQSHLVITATFGKEPGALHVVRALGTTFSVYTPGVDSTRVVGSIAAEWRELEDLFSPGLPDSEINRLRRGTLAWSEADNRLHSVALACRRLQIDTGGLFSAWHPGWFDPGDYVSGWAIRSAAAALYACGIPNFCISSDGETQTAGHGPKGGWRVSVADPARPDDPSTLVSLPSPGELAVATAGGSGASLTVVGDAIDQVGAIAWAALAAADGAPQVVRAAGFEAFGRDAAGNSWWTSGMPALATTLPE